MLNDLALYFSSAVCQSLLIIDNFDNDGELRDNRIEFCLDYFTKMSRAINDNDDYQDAIKWIIYKSNENSGCKVFVIFEKELQVFRNTSKVVSLLNKIKNKEDYSADELNEVHEIIIDLKKIILG
jgi:hypothetical protein